MNHIRIKVKHLSIVKKLSPEQSKELLEVIKKEAKGTKCKQEDNALELAFHPIVTEIREQRQTFDKRRAKPKWSIPEYSEFKEYALEKDKDVSLYRLQLKYTSWRENEWRDGHDKKIKNWKTKLLNTLPYLKDETSKKAANYSTSKEDDIAKTLFGNNK